MSTTNIGTLQIEMAANIARLQQDMEKAQSVVGGAMKQINDQVNMVKGALVGLGAALSIEAFAGMIKGSIEAAERLHDLAAQTGATVEALSAMGAVGKTSDTGLDMISQAMNKLAKNMSGATEDAKGAGKALEALGLNFDTFKSLKPEEQMQAVAKAMDNFADGSGKSAVAMALYGKEGARLIPFLKDLAEVGELHAKVTAEQAAMADNFDDNLVRLQASSAAWRKELAMGMLPALNEAGQAFLDVMNGTGGLRDEVRKLSQDGTIAEWTRNVITGFTYLMDVGAGVVRVFESIGKLLGALAGMGVAAANRDWAQARDIWKSFGDDMDKAWSDQTLGQKLRARMEELKGVTYALKEQKPALDANFNTDQKDKADKQAKAYADLVAAIREKIAVDNLQVELGRKLNDVEQQRLAIQKMVAAGQISAKDASSARTLALLAEYQAADEANKAMLARVAEQAEATKAYADLIDKQDAGTKSLKDEIDKQRQHNAELGLTKIQIADLQNAKLDEQATSKDRLATLADEIDTSGRLGDTYRAQAAALRELIALKKAGAIKETLVDEAKKAQEEWKKLNDEVSRGLTDALMRAFESGKGYAEAFRDTLVNMFKTLVLRPIIQYVLSPVTGAVTAGMGALGFPGAANAAGGFDQITNGASFLNSSSGLLGSLAASNAAYGAAIGTTSIGAGSQAAMLAAQTGEFGAAGVAATSEAAATAGAGFAAGASAAIPYVAAAVAAYYLLNNIGGGGPTITRAGGSRNFDAAGNITGSSVLAGWGEGGSSASVLDSYIRQLQATQRSLGVQAGGSASYSQSDGRGPLFEFGTGTGFYSGELARSADNFALVFGRATLDSLQHSDIPTSVKAFFAGLSPNTATLDQINQAIGAAQQFYGAINGLRDSLAGMPFAAIKSLSFDAAAGLAQFAGGLDKLKTDLNAYLTNFFSADEQRAAKVSEIARVLNAAGLQVSTAQVANATREQFRAVADSLDVSTAAGQRMYAAMMSVAQAFADITTSSQTAQSTVHSAVQSAQSSVDATFNSFKSAIAAQRQIVQASYDAAKQHSDELKGLFEMLGGYIRQLTTPLLGASRMEAGQQFIDQALATAKSTGYLPDQKQLADAIDAVRTGLDQQVYATQLDADRARLVLAGKLGDLQDISGQQLGVADQQLRAAQDQLDRLDALLNQAQSQLDALRGIDTSVISVADAVNRLAQAMQVEVGARGAVTAGAGGGGGGVSAGSPASVTVAPDVYSSNAINAIHAGASRQDVTNFLQADANVSGLSLERVAYNTVKAMDASLADFNTYYGLPAGSAEQWARDHSLPVFDVGTNYVPRDTLAMVHKGEAIVPRAYNPAAGGGEGAGTKTEIAQLRAEQQAQSAAFSAFMARMTRVLERWDGAGMPATRMT